MNPSDYAETELNLWEKALREQRAAEARLDAAPTTPDSALLAQIRDVVVLRRRADLLLAEAVRVKCWYREQGEGYAELAGPDDEHPAPAGRLLEPPLDD